MAKICIACEMDDKIKSKAYKFFQVYNNKNKVSAKWALDLGYINNVPPKGYEYLKNKKIKTQKNGEKFTINLPKKYANHYIYIWASKECHNKLNLQIPKKAYGYVDKKIILNDVFEKLDENAQITFKIKNPCVYQEKNIFPPHIHYKVANKKCSGFTNDFFTMTYLGNISHKYLLKKIKEGKTIVLNALQCKYYSKHNILGSFNLSYERAKKMNTNEIDNHIKDILINYPKLNNLVTSKKIMIKQIPIIVYCAHNNCNSGLHLANELLKHGYVNILDFKGGINEYYGKKIY